MFEQKKQDQETISPRQAPTTARAPLALHQNRFLDNYSFGYNPYATVHLRRPHQTTEKVSWERVKEMANHPFKRISRVQQMIHQQKNLLPLEGQPQGIKYNHSLRPHFKVRTSKQPLRNPHPTNHQHHRQDSTGTHAVHLQNLSLDCHIRGIDSNFFAPSSPHSPHSQTEQKSTLGITFTDTFKNRQRLNRKSPRKKAQASLLDMLNRISDGIHMQRYKSKAFDKSSKVTTFQHA